MDTLRELQIALVKEAAVSDTADQRDEAVILSADVANGSNLAPRVFRDERGWQVVGQDVDPNTAQVWSKAEVEALLGGKLEALVKEKIAIRYDVGSSALSGLLASAPAGAAVGGLFGAGSGLLAEEDPGKKALKRGLIGMLLGGTLTGSFGAGVGAGRASSANDFASLSRSHPEHFAALLDALQPQS